MISLIVFRFSRCVHVYVYIYIYLFIYIIYVYDIYIYMIERYTNMCI